MREKWGRRFFTGGAVVLLLLGCLHALSLFEKPVPANDTEKQLLGLMSGYRFNLMGSMRSANDLELGFSACFTLAMMSARALGLAVRRERVELVRRVATVFTIWLAAVSAVSLRYFFIAPTAFLVVALAMFALAWGCMTWAARGGVRSEG